MPLNNNNDEDDDGDGIRQRVGARAVSASHKAQALSMSFMKAISGICCEECGNDPLVMGTNQYSKEKDYDNDKDDVRNRHAPSELYNLQVFQHQSSTVSNSSISPLVMAPMTNSSSSVPYYHPEDPQLQPDNNHMMPPNGHGIGSSNGNNGSVSSSITVEGLLGEYMCLCRFYQVPYNAGIITTLRYSLPSLRVSGAFHDLDMLALVELLLRHANGRLRFIRRLDFTVASKEGKRGGDKSSKLGFTSHGALALAKALQTTHHILQVWLPRHRIGPYGASALFLACRDNSTIQNLDLRKCRIGERGAFAFCELMLSSTNTTETSTSSSDSGSFRNGRNTSILQKNKEGGLIEVDLSSNGIGHRGTSAIERAVAEWNKNSPTPLIVNLEGNLVFPEIMNGITHGLGVVLSLIGGRLLFIRVQDQSLTHTISCAIYTASLLALYLSSTLYHSLFSLQHIKYIFQVMDKCAIYILIAGSYTPFLTVMFSDKPMFSIGLLGFIWTCGVLGISVEAFYPTWKWRPVFSLCMYLGMGWAAAVCLPETGNRLPVRCIHLLILGGVGYTAGVPFFIRDNNLDHAIWHLFVLSGSIIHWLAVYLYVAPMPLVCPAES